MDKCLKAKFSETGPKMINLSIFIDSGMNILLTLDKLTYKFSNIIVMNSINFE
jgi:hypothetical protein